MRQELILEIINKQENFIEKMMNLYASNKKEDQEQKNKQTEKLLEMLLTSPLLTNYFNQTPLGNPSN